VVKPVELCEDFVPGTSMEFEPQPVSLPVQKREMHTRSQLIRATLTNVPTSLWMLKKPISQMQTAISFINEMRRCLPLDHLESPNCRQNRASEGNQTKNETGSPLGLRSGSRPANPAGSAPG
jgi:hypothetical protein